MNKPQPNDSEDNALWEEITRDIRKLPAREIPPSKPVILPEIKPSVNLAAAYRGEILPELAVGGTEGMDGSMAKRFKRCEFPVEEVLDLHGYREDDAFEAVFGFVQKAYLQNKRCIIIITGKGLTRSEETDVFTPKGKLKESVPRWLNSRELRPLILAFNHPPAKLGGSGALYILLRRHR